MTRSGAAITGVTLADGTHLAAPVVVNAAGAWCAPLAATVQVDLPVLPVMRTVYTIETSIDNAALPSVFLPSGLYVIPEAGGRFLVGWSQPDDPVGYDFNFSRGKVLRIDLARVGNPTPRLRGAQSRRRLGRACTRSTPSTSNAIIGEWPELQGLYLANGFSGHGFQHAPAVGRHLAELILGRPPIPRPGPLRSPANHRPRTALRTRRAHHLTAPGAPGGPLQGSPRFGRQTHQGTGSRRTFGRTLGLVRPSGGGAPRLRRTRR